MYKTGVNTSRFGLSIFRIRYVKSSLSLSLVSSPVLLDAFQLICIIQSERNFRSFLWVQDMIRKPLVFSFSFSLCRKNDFGWNHTRHLPFIVEFTKQLYASIHSHRLRNYSFRIVPFMFSRRFSCREKYADCSSDCLNILHTI